MGGRRIGAIRLIVDGGVAGSEAASCCLFAITSPTLKSTGVCCKRDAKRVSIGGATTGHMQHNRQLQPPGACAEDQRGLVAPAHTPPPPQVLHVRLQLAFNVGKSRPKSGRRRCRTLNDGLPIRLTLGQQSKNYFQRHNFPPSLLTRPDSNTQKHNPVNSTQWDPLSPSDRRLSPATPTRPRSNSPSTSTAVNSQPTRMPVCSRPPPATPPSPASRKSSP